MKKMILTLILWALSFGAFSQLPSWILSNSTYSEIIFITVNVIFAYAFIKFAKE